MRSSTTGSLSEASVSPVPVSLRPTKAAMSPAWTSLISARLSACIWNIRPTRSFSSLVVFITVSPAAQRAGIDPHEGQGAVLVVDDLERQARERRVGVGLDAAAVAVLAILLAFLGRDGDAGHVDRGGQEVQHRVEQRLHALVLERGAAQHGAEVALDGALLDGALQRLDGHVALVEILLHALVIHRQRGVEQVLAVLGRLLLEVGRDLLVVELGAQFAAFPDDGLHLDQVDHADERVLDADRQLQGQRHDVELLLQRVERPVEIGAGAVELVDEDDARHVVAVGQAPVGLALRLHARHALDDEHRAVEHAQAAVHLDVEVDVAGRVDDVDAVVLPLARHRGGGDGDAALALLLHVVGRGVAVMHLADAVRNARVVQDALGRRRLAGIDMRGDPDIAELGQRCECSHDSLHCARTGAHFRQTETDAAGAVPRAPDAPSCAPGRRVLQASPFVTDRHTVRG